MSTYQLDPGELRRHRRTNFLQAIVLLLALGGVLALAGWIVAGGGGLIGMLIGGAIVVSMTPKIGPAVMLRLYVQRAGTAAVRGAPASRHPPGIRPPRGAPPIPAPLLSAEPDVECLLGRQPR